MVDFVTKNIRNIYFLADRESKRTSMIILKGFIGNNSKIEFTVNDFIDFSRQHFPHCISQKLTLSGFYSKLSRLKKNNILNLRKDNQGRIFYKLSGYGVEKLNNINREG